MFQSQAHQTFLCDSSKSNFYKTPDPNIVFSCCLYAEMLQLLVKLLPQPKIMSDFFVTFINQIPPAPEYLKQRSHEWTYFPQENKKYNVLLNLTCGLN
jgi:hypothetical protein